VKGKQRRGGRKPGVPNKITTEVKTAIKDAAAHIGSDGNGFVGLTGFLIRLGLLKPAALGTLIGKTMPLEIAASVQHRWDMSKLSDDEVVTMQRIAAKALAPKVAAPQSGDIVDLEKGEYTDKVDEILRTVPNAEVQAEQ
jgi:hypothetical protein